MLVKFLAHGTGSAQAAADYLTRELDSQGEVREDVAVLRGDPDAVAAVGRHAGVRPQVHVGRDRLGPGGPAKRPGHRPGARRVRADRLVRAGSGSLRVGGGAAPRGHRRRARACARRAVRPGDRQEPQHRAAGLAADLRPPGRGPEPRPGLEPPGRPGARPGAAAGAPRLPRGGGAASGDRARRRPARGDPGLPAAARRARHGAGPGGRRRRPTRGGLRRAAAG